MAYMNQTKKAELSGGIKSVCKKYGFKCSIAVRNHSTLEVTITEGPLDFMGLYIKSQYNEETMPTNWKPTQLQLSALRDYSSVWSDPTIQAFMSELSAAMMNGNHDRSDSMTDYFDVGWYAYINLGKWDRHYQYTEHTTKAAA